MAQKLVIIGAGMASGRLIEQLIDTDASAYDIILINAEPRGNYNRIMLSPVLSGDKTYKDIVTHSDEWYADNNITTYFGEAVTAVDRKNKTVSTASHKVAYDRLVIATGSAPIIIPVAGKELPGVMAYRDLDDVNSMLEACEKPAANAVVIGGGLLGLEAAAGLKQRGMEVTVLHIAPHLMERQLDPAAGHLLRKDLERRDINIHTEAYTKAILGNHKVDAVLLEDGTIYPADIVVMSVGIRPETRLATDMGLAVERGIVVDDNMRTSVDDIFAVGECIEHRDQLFGLVAPLYDQAKVLAKTLLGEEAVFSPVELSTKLKVTGCDLFSAGDFADADDREEIVFRDAVRGVYKRLILQNDVIIGAVMYGDTDDGGWFLQKIKSGEDISGIRDTLIFGPNFAGGAPVDPLAAVAALPLDAEICGCNGVSKGDILAAIEAGADGLDAVKAITKASTSCGTCAGLTAQVVQISLGDDFILPEAATLCKCTDYSHDDVRKLILSKGLKTIPQAMQDLQWKTSCGCITCRPALNYYMVCAWPGDYVDDGQSRYINERVHANIQKDGTYSVVPRMFGGITTPDELRAIADVADKFNVPTVKVTGGQRIDLLGIEKEDLPAIWYDLNAAGMMSGQAYAKGLRTVKTCVGSDHCRFGTQDSTGLGIKLEKSMWGAWSPHKFKLAVSGCPRNCAEATCKDLGIICVDSGYQVLVGGAAGMDLRETDLLAQVVTEDEAIELAEAFYQLYREGAQYLHRPYKWIAKVGLDWCKEQLVDDLENRAALSARFRHSQQFYQVDPWEQRASKGHEAYEYAPLADFTKEAAE